MKTIKIKNSQFPCLKRWVEQAVYIEPKDKKPLITAIKNIKRNGNEIFINFTPESIQYLNEHCPLGFIQSWAKINKLT